MESNTPSSTSPLRAVLAFLLRNVTGLVLLAAGITLGFYLGNGSAPQESHSEAHPTAHEEAGPQVWTCSMHPQVQQPNPGQCPLCGMDLIPLEEDRGDGGPRTFKTSDAAKALMQIETSEVEHRFVAKKIRMVGKLDFDETRLGYITAWVPGRIDRLFVDYTGVEVQKGDHLVDLYSPELILAQAELRQAAKAVADMRPTSPDVLKRTAETTLQATRDKLRRWGLTDRQINDAETKGVGSDHITIYAPMSGTVIDRVGQEGMYVDEGTRVYTIADLSTLWLQLDAYESDLTWLHYGQSLTFTTEAYPGETFEGKISFIDPVLNKDTRTVKVRVVVENKDKRLKPEMFVRAVVEAQVATGGRVMDQALAGKWISPMHPEIVKDTPGSCDVCGMALVKAEKLGYVPATATESDMPLVIPASAPLVTGTRAVVYVEQPGAEAPTYEGRSITLGPRAGDYYIVEDGLSAGERVVTRGNFKIDSALQIQAKSSMMSGDEAEDHTGHGHAMADAEAEIMTYEAPADFKAQLAVVMDAYATLSDALAADDERAGEVLVPPFLQAVDGVDMQLLKGDAHMAWMTLLEELKQSSETLRAQPDIETQRNALAPLTAALTRSVKTFGLPEGLSVWRMHCPMALDSAGADWLQLDEEKRNPYMGAAMLKCGTVEESLTDPPPAADHGATESMEEGSSTKAGDNA